MVRRSRRRVTVTRVVSDEAAMTSDEIRMWRDRMGWDKATAADSLGIAENTYYGYENEKRSVSPSIRLLTRYVEKYGMLK